MTFTLRIMVAALKASMLLTPELPKLRRRVPSLPSCTLLPNCNCRGMPSHTRLKPDSSSVGAVVVLRVQAVFYYGRGVPLARVVLLLKVLAFYKSEFWHNFQLFF